MKVFISPTPRQSGNNHGIGQVIQAQYKYLPSFGIELERWAENADVIAPHLQGLDLPRIDVLHNHGLYWTGDGQGIYEFIHHSANKDIIESVRRCNILTVPSDWVAMPFRRDMRIDPVVIGHGIELAEWDSTLKKDNYILWNKTRTTDVCSPTGAYELAKAGYLIKATLPPNDIHLPENYHVIGLMGHGEMKKWIAHAGIYLATTQETFGIGVLEAMACGVPILGYNWGGTAEIVRHGMDGYLAQPNNIADLKQGAEWIRENRERLEKNAVERAREFGWGKVIEKYAAVYKDALEMKQKENHRVTIVITNYNYGKYLEDAIGSAVTQTEKCEVIVVDDGSTDNSLDVTELFRPHDIKVIEQKNQGVAAARNAGIEATDAEYIVCLDADDKLAPNYARVCKEALDADKGLGIAYTGLGFLNDQGLAGDNVWKTDFGYERQTEIHNPPATTIHCAAMFRRKMWERVGGYRQKFAPAEDAEFWTVGTSIGFRAKRVTSEPLFIYRNHPGGASRKLQYRSIAEDYPFMQTRVFWMGAPAAEQPIVRSYSNPVVSIIIPVGRGHEKYLYDCIRSVMAQTIVDWEIVLGDDTGESELEKIVRESFPFCRIAKIKGDGGAGSARNKAIEIARAPLLFFLDADDWMRNDTLAAMLSVYAKGNAGYIYSAWNILQADGVLKEDGAPAYSQVEWFKRGQHAVSVLIAKEDSDHIGNFDESMEGWEDWDYFLKCAVSGICGEPVQLPLLTYRHGTGSRREKSFKQREQLLKFLHKRYEAYADGGKDFMGCCGGNANAVKVAQQATRNIKSPDAPIQAGKIRMQFIGAERGAITYYVNGRRYVGANMDEWRYVDANEEDVARLEAMGVWRKARVQETIFGAPVGV